MCGIVGLVSNFTNGFGHKEADMFSTMLLLNTQRGWDSTGVFGVTTLANVDVVKEACHGADFINTPEYKTFRSDMVASGKFMVGHNRAATKGKIVDTNAHPFVIDDKIVLVQNGTYKGDHTKHKKTEVDTEAVAHVIAETEDIAEALRKINASYALVWYNADLKQLNLIRNSERPLWIAGVGGTGLAFASEPAMIYYAAGRNEVKITQDAELLPEYVHVVLTLDGKGGYTRTDTKLDAAFVYSKSDVADIDDYSLYGFEHQHGHRRKAVAYSTTQAVRTPHVFGANDVKHSFFDIIADNFPAYMFPTKEAMETSQNDVLSVCNGVQECIVEVYDYSAANDDRQCTAWHVYGYVVSPDIDPEKPHVLIHWLEFSKTEKEVLDMSSSEFYRCKLSGIQTRQVWNKGQQSWMTTAFATQHTKLESVDA